MDDASGKCVKILVPFVWNAPTCNRCGHPEVDIFQDEGEFCCSCWTKRTEPYVTPPVTVYYVSDEKKREEITNLADYYNSSIL